MGGSTLRRAWIASIVIAAVTVFGLGTRSWILRDPVLTNLDRAAAKVQATGAGASAEEELAALDKLRECLEELADHRRFDRVPWIRDMLARPGEETYREAVRRDFARPAAARLAEEIRSGGPYGEQRERVTLYLALGAPEHIDARASSMLLRRWEDVARPRAKETWGLRERIKGHLDAHVERIRSRREPPLPIDAALAAEVRARLERVPGPDRLRSYVVDSLADQRCKSSKPDGSPFLAFAPLTVESLFENRAAVLRALGSRRVQQGGARPIVEGIHTQRGHAAVLQRMKRAAEDIAWSAWAIAPSPEEQGDALEANLRRIYEAYAQRAVEQRAAWIEDVVVRPPATVAEAREVYRALLENPWPYTLLLREVAAFWPDDEPGDLDGCFPRPEPCDGDPVLAWKHRQEAVARWRRLTGHEEPPMNALSRWAATQSRAVRVPLNPWAQQIAAVLEVLGRPEDRVDLRRPAKALAEARAEIERLLAPLDASVQRVWGPLLLDPLRFEPR